jgi:shikimate dehydrogenase
MRKFGLIGYPLSHSFSQKFFTEKFQKEGIADAVYQNFPLQNIETLSSLLQAEPGLNGLNVTIPYKEQVIPFLHYKNEVVEKTGACNCIKIQDGSLYGYNTDTIGFERSLKKKLQKRHSHALILGTGGAAKAVEYVLQQLGIEYRLVSRNPDRSVNEIGYADIDASVIQSHTLIINTTPVGMFPKTHEYPSLPYQHLGPHHYLFDLVYNPEETAFLQKGKERGAAIMNGHEMLIIQAEESWKIWNEDRET